MLKFLHLHSILIIIIINPFYYVSTQSDIPVVSSFIDDNLKIESSTQCDCLRQDSLPKTCFQLANPEDDPCNKLSCTFGSSCKRSKDGRKAECVCPKKCYNYGDSVGSRPVCGSDGRDYPNECEVRKRSCELNKEINIKFHGKCDPCDGVQCPSSQVCQLDENRNPICRCNALCPQDFKPVCGSDGKTYTNECILRVEGCKARKSLRILYNGECGQGRGSNPCDSLKCSINQECEIDRYGIASCVCPSECPQIMKPVCGSDGKTYDSECDLRYQACVEHKNITMMYRGLCGEDGACNGFNCEFGAVCVVRPPDSQPSCECQSCTEEYKPVCGSDNISHHNECKLRRESCEQQKVIKVVSEGQCDGCQGVECKHNSVCRVDPSDGVGQCTCPSSCPNIKSPVCGSDKLTYPNECELRLASCLKKEDITIDSRGPCDACFNVHCKYGARCELGKCVCPTECPMTYEPICASDGNTYVNECQMRVNSCQSNIELEIVFYGECPGKKAPETVIGSGIGYIKKCDPNTCRFGGVCDYDVENIPHCICSYHCPSGGSADEAVCGSDGRLYENECKLQEEACRRQQEIQPAINQLCEDSKLLPCNGESPLIDPATGRDYSCGDELNAKQCPRKSYCHRSSHFAKCCREEKIIRSCSESQFGCCPDGVTVAQGPEHAGCPSVCNCNKIGSYSATCDPVSRQCHCKVGVGGLQCDRCEHGFWGLSKISEGNSGCIPCSCNMNGSVRDDCEQMTGRCVCKHGLQGMKCNVCPDDTVLDSQGCIHVSLTRYYSGSCSDMKCRYGATCVDNPEKGIQCVCNMRCSMMDLNASTLVSTSEVICASDGNTYLSECQMKFFACRMQRKLSMVHRGQCRISASRPPSAKFDENAVTQGPVRRSTMYKTSQQSSRETPAIELTLSYSDPTSVRTTTAPPIISQRVIKVPAFMGNSYIEIPRLQAHTKLSIELELVAHSDSGVILYNGQTATGDGDFVSISLKKGFVEFRYDLGSGKVKLISSKKILLGQIIKIVAKRYLKEGILTVDGQPDVSGFSEGELKSLDLAENLFIGSIPSKSLKIYDNVGVRQGFVGCIHRLGIGGIDTDFSYPESKSILKIHNVQDCQEAPCSQNKCENGGTCAPGSDSNFNTFKCVCPKGFTGQNCEIKDEVCIQANPCIRGTICTLLPFGGFSCLCSHGKNGKICSKMPRETSNLITAFIGSSYLALPTPQNIAQAFVLEVWFLSRDENGLILYSGQNLPKDRGDFLAVNIVDRHIKFSYNLGSTIPSIIGYASIMSKDKITLNKWHSLRLTRFQKKGTLQLDEEPVQFGESWGDLNELNLDQPLYIGGIPEGLNYSRHIGPVLGMSGAIQRIVINGEVVDDLLKRAIEIHNLDEYRGLPCGHKSPCPNNTICLPQLDDYLCRCVLNDKKLCSASLVSENIMDYHATSEELRFI